MADTTTSTFVIEELSGEKRKFELSGRAMPYRKPTFGGKMRLEKTYYGGNPIGTIQFFGAEETETSFKGMWKDRFIYNPGNGSQPEGVFKVDGRQMGGADECVQAMDDLRRKGQMVKVTWGFYVRVGALEEFNSTPENLKDIEWEAKFTWVSQGDTAQGLAVPSTTNYTDVAGNWQGQKDNLANIASQYALASSYFGQVQDAINNVTGGIDDVIAAVDQNTRFVTSTLDTFRGIVGALQNIIDATQEAMDVVTSSVPGVIVSEIIDNEGTANNIQTQLQLGQSPFGQPLLAQQVQTLQSDFGKQASACNYQRQLMQTLKDSQRMAARQQQELARAINPDVLWTFVATDDTDLRSVAEDFYGSQQDWKIIAQFNALTDSRLVAGQVVYVPIAVNQAS